MFTCFTCLLISFIFVMELASIKRDVIIENELLYICGEQYSISHVHIFVHYVYNFTHYHIE